MELGFFKTFILKPPDSNIIIQLIIKGLGTNYNKDGLLEIDL